MKDPRPWTCPCCGGLNHPDIAFCPCGDSHRDEKPVDWKPEPRDGGTVAAVVCLVVGVVGTLALAWLIARGAK